MRIAACPVRAGGLSSPGLVRHTGDVAHIANEAKMRRNDVLKTLDEHRAEMEERLGIRSLAIFGSVARDEAHEGSDPEAIRVA